MTEIILTSSVLICFLITLRALLRGRIHPTVQYALWLLVAARLLIPGTLFTAPVSVMGAAGELQTALENTLHIENSADANLPVYTIPDYIPPERTEDNGDTIITYYPPQATAPTPPAAAINWVDIIWKTGMTLIGSILFLSNLIFYVRLSKNRRQISHSDLPHPCSIPVYLADDLATPCLCGIFRPAIYVNRDALDPAKLEHILTHEETHLRHGDHLWALLRSLCLVIHWYNPLVWWAAALSRRDCELSCDAAALRRLGEDQHIAYGKTLLSMISPRTSPADLLRTATTMTAGKRTMKERIQLIAKAPKMLKITLIPVVLAACVAAVLVFGGAAEGIEPAGNTLITDNSPTHEDSENNSTDTPNPTTTPLTEEEAIELYHQAREVWNWFELGILPTTDAVLSDESGNLLRVAEYDSLAELRSKLEQHFSPEISESLLTGYLTFREFNGGLYVLPAGRSSSIYAGKETVTAFPMVGAEAAQYGYDCHIHAATEVLDAYDLTTVLYEKQHHWYMIWNGQNHVFTSFGPSDAVDPQKYYNALTIVEHYTNGADVITWWPMLACLDWNALRATEEHWPENTDMCYEVNVGILEYIKAQNFDLTAAEYNHILSATTGLDGAYAEMYQYTVYQLYRNNPVVFAYVVLDGLSPNNQAQIIDFLRFEEQYHRSTPPDGTPMTREETIAMLRKTLSEALSASPSEMTFTQSGQSALFTPISAYGVYAVSYTSSDPSVAAVDELGFVTAVGPGKTTITLHYEGTAGQREFTCAVTCDWGGEPPTFEPLEQDAQVMLGLARGYGPTVYSAGSPENLELTLTGDWTLKGIETALLSAVQRHMKGTLLEGDARSVTISYAFQFPDKMQDGVVMEVPFFIDYVDTDVFTLPSGATHSPSGRTNELTAKVTLSGRGTTAPVDEKFASGQSLYQKLSACVSVPEIQVPHDLEQYDLGMEIINHISSNLSDAGISAHVDGLSFGSYQNPAWCPPGYTQIVSGFVSFRYEGNYSASFPIQITVHTVE